MKQFTKTLGGVVFTASGPGQNDLWIVSAHIPAGDFAQRLLASRTVRGEFDAGRTFQALIDQHAVERADVQRDQHLDSDRTVEP